MKAAQSCPTLCDPMDYTYTVHGILQAKITGVGSLSLLQGIFPTQGSNPGLPHCRWIIYQLSHKGSQIFYVSSDNKYIKSRINIALYLAKDLEFIRGSGHGNGCNLKVILRY